MWSNWPVVTYNRWPYIFCITFLMMTLLNKCKACGHYQRIGGGGQGEIATQVEYPAYQHCIWWLETDTGYQLSINITYVGDTNYGRCGDYIIIRDGKIDDDTSILLDESQSCSTLTNHVVTARASWLMVQFKSDGLNYTNGFQGYISSTYVGASITNYSNPIVDCRSYEFPCSNKVCMTLSYRCDGFNDCGCSSDCDEAGCGGIALEKVEILGIGIGMGFGIFIAFFMFAFAYETHLKRRAINADPAAQAALQKAKARRRRKAQLMKAEKEKKGRR